MLRLADVDITGEAPDIGVGLTDPIWDLFESDWYTARPICRLEVCGSRYELAQSSANNCVEDDFRRQAHREVRERECKE